MKKIILLLASIFVTVMAMLFTLLLCDIMDGRNLGLSQAPYTGAGTDNGALALSLVTMGICFILCYFYWTLYAAQFNKGLLAPVPCPLCGLTDRCICTTEDYDAAFNCDPDKSYYAEQ